MNRVDIEQRNDEELIEISRPVCTLVNVVVNIDILVAVVDRFSKQIHMNTCRLMYIIIVHLL
jgi:hypothetical protein